MATLFHVTGGYTYVDPYGVALGYEDVFTKLEHATRHYESVGLGKEYATRLVRCRRARRWMSAASRSATRQLARTVRWCFSFMAATGAASGSPCSTISPPPACIQ